MTTIDMQKAQEAAKAAFAKVYQATGQTIATVLHFQPHTDPAFAVLEVSDRSTSNVLRVALAASETGEVMVKTTY